MTVVLVTVSHTKSPASKCMRMCIGLSTCPVDLLSGSESTHVHLTQLDNTVLPRLFRNWNQYKNALPLLFAMPYCHFAHSERL
jgi:hypothetical protein